MYKCNFSTASHNELPNYFNFSELITTSVKCSNYPLSSEHMINLSQLWYILNRIRHTFGSPIYINSAYRTPGVNTAVGGVANSYHLKGRAADIRTIPHLMDEFRQVLNDIKEQHPNLFVEFIDYGTFFHIAI